MAVTEVKNVREAVIHVLAENPNLTKYRLAKELNLSTSSHINNFLSEATKKTRVEVLRLLFKKFDVLVEAYKETPEYRKSQKQEPKEIQL
jgi:hypothetical protein